MLARLWGYGWQTKEKLSISRVENFSIRVPATSSGLIKSTLLMQPARGELLDLSTIHAW